MIGFKNRGFNRSIPQQVGSRRTCLTNNFPLILEGRIATDNRRKELRATGGSPTDVHELPIDTHVKARLTRDGNQCVFAKACAVGVKDVSRQQIGAKRARSGEGRLAGTSSKSTVTIPSGVEAFHLISKGGVTSVGGRLTTVRPRSIPVLIAPDRTALTSSPKSLPT